MDRTTRQKLKSDDFALELGHAVTFFEGHQKEITRYGGIVAVAAVLVAGYIVYNRHQHVDRQIGLAQAIAVQEAPVGVSANGGLSFPNQESKDAAAIKVFSDLKAKYAGTAEGEIAQYYLASIEADKGNMATAEKGFLEVAQKGDADYASLAKLSLAQIYFDDNRNKQAEDVLKDLIAHPTVFVSKDEATLALARYYAHTNPAEARKLLEPLRVSPVDAVRNVAISLIAEMQQSTPQ
ncbi:MAG TPA: tetratricopeptide repeat protein [Verrucomicrobiae bacterium]|nr:tetratricopeptide repeat protein [Verrucomicrobiae bacterium]